MRGMDKQPAEKKENPEMLDNNIRQFIDATRQYFFGMLPSQTQLAAPAAHTPR